MLRFTPARGHFWEFRTRPARRASATAPDDAETNDEEMAEFDEQLDTDTKEKEGHKRTRGAEPLTTRATPYQSQRTHALLAALGERFKGGDEIGRGAGGQTAAEGGATKMKTDSPSTGGDPQSAPSVPFSSSLISDFQGLLFPPSVQKQNPMGGGGMSDDQ
ncbi:hypothetical protein niasHT_037971 [Heterodera trifolii]|uniref:Uncharacterized protein n=1 Tax=Heterodera trifolii TaxID=157864 RepID=A0ABD2HPW8_9BILA